MIKRLAAIKRQENNRAASSLLSVTFADVLRFFDVTILWSLIFEYAMLQRTGKSNEEKYDAPFITAYSFNIDSKP